MAELGFYLIFPHYFLNDVNLGEIIEYDTCVLSFSTIFV